MDLEGGNSTLDGTVFNLDEQYLNNLLQEARRLRY